VTVRQHHADGRTFSLCLAAQERGGFSLYDVKTRLRGSAVVSNANDHSAEGEGELKLAVKSKKKNYRPASTIGTKQNNCGRRKYCASGSRLYALQ